MNKCKKCGGFYDAGETCACEEAHRPIKRAETKEELKERLANMSYAEYTAYQMSNIAPTPKRKSYRKLVGI